MRSHKQQKSRTVLATVLPLVWLVVFSTYTQALGLENVQPSSYLGQPLLATIAITTGNESYGPEELRVRQLSAKQAADLGIDLASTNERYRMTLSDQSGRLEILVTSNDPIEEPFLNFLVELKWPTGTVYREYTVFLDPPGFLTAVSANKLSKQQPISSPRPVNEQQSSADLTPGGGRYSVQSGDSLSRIAATLVKGTDTTRNEMMRWLVDNNQQAFQNGDMNRLLAGAQLRLPAQARFAQQASRSSSTSSRIADIKPKPPRPAVQQLPSKPVMDNRNVTERLTIVTPNTSRGSISAEELSQAETILALRDTVIATQELADRMQRDNEALQKRLEAIENSGYLDSMERLVELKEQEIQTLKNRLAETELNKKRTQVSVATENGSGNNALEGSLQRWLLIILLFLALIGAAYFFYRWRLMQAVGKDTKSQSINDEQALLNELEAMAITTPKPSRAKSKSSQLAPEEVLDATRQGFEDLGKKARDAERRSEDQIKESIRQKTNSYIPDILAGKNESDYDSLDRLIAEALQAANRGSFGVAEAMLLAERTEQVRKPSKRENEGDVRLEAAIVYVDQLREIKYSQHFKNS